MGEHIPLLIDTDPGVDDALAMAVALEPENVESAETRALAVELSGALTRGAMVVDWLRRGGRPEQVRILLRYRQQGFEALRRRALGAGQT
jgi:purine nucleosidase